MERRRSRLRATPFVPTTGNAQEAGRHSTPFAQIPVSLPDMGRHGFAQRTDIDTNQNMNTNMHVNANFT